MVQLRKIGRFFPLSSEGFIVNDCDSKYIDPLLVNEVNAFYKKHFGEKLHSVYVRGSVARGNLLPGISDLDTFGVVDINSVSQAVPGSFEESVRLVQAFPDLIDIVFVVVPLHTVLSERRNPFTFLLQTQSCCIYGSSLQAKLAPYRPNIEIIGEALYLRHRIQKYLSDIESIEDPIQVKMQCTILMKGIVRSAYDLVLPVEQQYTRDLYFCYEGFVRHHPEHEANVRQALVWAIEPTADKPSVARFLSEFGSWLCVATDELMHKNNLINRKEA